MIFKSLSRNHNNENGQALLIIVLIMVIALTVGLSIVSRTVTNLRVSTEQANSQKALGAAEAGLEQAIAQSLQNPNNTSTIAGSTASNITYSTSIASVSANTQFLLNGGNLLSKDDGVYIWMTNYSSNPSALWQPPYWNGTLTLYWGASGNACNEAAIEVALITGTRTSPSIKRYAFDPCGSRGNNLTAASSSVNTVGGRTFYYMASIPNVTNGIVARVIPLYYSTYMGALGSSPLPFQGTTFTSTGIADTTSSNPLTRKVQVYQGYPELPTELFPYSLFSP